MNTQSADDSRPATKDILREIAARLKTIEGALALLREGRNVSERYDPIHPYK